MGQSGLTVRGYEPADLPAAIDICVRTGDDGADATGQYVDDGLLAAVYATPYVLLEPELAFVVDDGTRAVGYILGTSDTPTFIHRYRTEYLPDAAAAYPLPDAEDQSASAAMIRGGLYVPERLWRPQYVRYPAHLHIDLLPIAQGTGLGGALMRRFLGALQHLDVPGVMLGMSAANGKALGFYRRFGFVPLPIDEYPGTVHLGLRLES